MLHKCGRVNLWSGDLVVKSFRITEDRLGKDCSGKFAIGAALQCRKGHIVLTCGLLHEAA
ncbi:MAG: hypothetical protein CMM76_10985 [Rhodospirillaceae bacterium]|nr:hypothetical protein [Rhodospirillaceae bacterium]